MALISELSSSNAVQLLLTFAFGAALYFLKVRVMIVIVAITLSVGIVLSFVLLVGEVYVYSDIYRRAFFIFGDDISSVLNFGFLYAFTRKKIGLSLLILVAIFMSGGKISIVLLLLMMVAFILIQRRGSERKAEVVLFSKLSLSCTLIYVVLSVVSLQLLEFPNVVSFREGVVQAIGGKYGLPNHRSACSSLSRCYETQVGSALLQRYYTSLGGLWMTLDGGYPGKRYPGSPEKFADLMVEANPWGINDRYGLTRSDWKRMGGVQNPYMSFGSGYGPWLLLALIGIFSVIGYLALRNLVNGESDIAAIFSIFFIVTIVFNQTQSWLMSGSPILALLGLTAGHIFMSWLLRSGLVPKSWQSFWARNLVLRGDGRIS